MRLAGISKLFFSTYMVEEMLAVFNLPHFVVQLPFFKADAATVLLQVIGVLHTLRIVNDSALVVYYVHAFFGQLSFRDLSTLPADH